MLSPSRADGCMPVYIHLLESRPMLEVNDVPGFEADVLLASHQDAGIPDAPIRMLMHYARIADFINEMFIHAPRCWPRRVLLLGSDR